MLGTFYCLTESFRSHRSPDARGRGAPAAAGGGHEGLFETNQLRRRESSAGAVQRAQAAAAKARALAM
ncbi:morn4 [Pungitius sinensis]